VLVSYLLGGVPVGLLIGNSRGIDIRAVGSGNIGATNVLRVFGAKLGVLALLLDILKGLAPVLLATHVAGLNEWPVAACALAAVVGHCFSPYIGFQGGKGVATACGVTIGLCWPAGLVAVVLWVALVFVTRYVSLGSMIATAATGPVAWAFGGGWPVTVPIIIIATLSIVQHRSNIRRLLAGREPKIGQSAARPGAAVAHDDDALDTKPEDTDA